MGLIVEYKEYIAGIALAISGLLLALRNYFTVINLRLQNKSLRKELDGSDEIVRFSLPKIEKIKYYSLPELDQQLATISGVSIKSSGMLLDTLDKLSLKIETLSDLLSSEFRSHPILLDIEYESLPTPLKNGYFAILSKQENTVYIEAIFQTAPKQDLVELWAMLSSKYFSAYRLPFRKNSSLLSNADEYEKSKNLISELFELVQKYTYESSIYSDEEIHRRFHQLKGGIALGVGRAEVAYERYISREKNEEYLKEVVLGLDSAISCVHKILVEYKPPQ